MNPLISLLMGMSPGEHIEITELESGLIVSTVNSLDLGPETAIIDRNGVHPVERYNSTELARDGHFQWVSKIEGGLREITKLGYMDVVEEEMITLKE